MSTAIDPIPRVFLARQRFPRPRVEDTAEAVRGELEKVFPGKVTNSRGLGLFLAFDLPDGEVRNRTLRALNDSDVLGLASGERAIRMRPPLVLSSSEAAEGLRRVERALVSVLS